MVRQNVGAASDPWPRMMSIGAVVGMAIIMSMPAHAQSRRANSTAMTCDQVRSMIDQRGAVIMNTGPNTFDRYVSNRGFCQRTEIAKTDYVPTRDAAKCPVKRCVNVTPRSFGR